MDKNENWLAMKFLNVYHLGSNAYRFALKFSNLNGFTLDVFDTRIFEEFTFLFE